MNIKTSFFNILILPILLLFLIFSSLKFQITNYKFLVNSFEKHQIYSKIPELLIAGFSEQGKKIGFNEASNVETIRILVDQHAAKETVESNTESMIGFLNGLYDEFTFRPPFLLVLPVDISPEGDSLSVFPPSLTNQLMFLHGITEKITVVWVISLVILLTLSFMELRRNSKLFAKHLIVYSLVIGLLVFLTKQYVSNMTLEFSQSTEAFKILFSIFSTSVVPDVLNVWGIFCIAIFIFGLLLLGLANVFKRKRK